MKYLTFIIPLVFGLLVGVAAFADDYDYQPQDYSQNTYQQQPEPIIMPVNVIRQDVQIQTITPQFQSGQVVPPTIIMGR